jgi:hypothetical protein
MPAPATRTYRLTIRNPTDTADALVVSSIPGANCYLAAPPSGDGQSYDPLTGLVAAGSYKIQIIDAAFGVVTPQLADDSTRDALIDCRAFIHRSTDGGTTWDELIGGYTTAARCVDALLFEIEIGDAYRREARTMMFAEVTTTYDRTTAIVGGPVRGQFLGSTDPVGSDRGPWRFSVIGVAGGIMQLKFVSGWGPSSLAPGAFSAWGYVINRPTDAMLTRAAAMSAPYAAPIPATGTVHGVAVTSLHPTGVTGYYPRLRARVSTTAGVLLDVVPPLQVQNLSGTAPALLWQASITASEYDLALVWSATSPAVGTLLDLYIEPEVADESSPLHVVGHPLDIIRAGWDQASIAYDGTTTTAVRSAIGDNLLLAILATAGIPLATLIAQLGLFFGFGVRTDKTGRRVPFTTRVIADTLPTQTITLAELRSGDGIVWERAAATAVGRVKFSEPGFARRTVTDGEWDEIHVVPLSFWIDGAVADRLSGPPKEISVTLPGSPGRQLFGGNGFQPDIAYGLYPSETKPILDGPLGRPLHSAMARDVVATYGRGGALGTLYCVDSVTAQVGDEVLVTLPHRPSGASRGGARVVRVLHCTPKELEGGVDLQVIDRGSGAQIATAPTFTLAALGTDPQHVARLTLTNPAALIAQGTTLNAEWMTGSSAPTVPGFPTDPLDPTLGTTLDLPAAAAGETVWVRARSVRDEARPSAWTAWTSVALTALVGPSITSVVWDATLSRFVVTMSGGDAVAAIDVLTAPNPYTSATLQPVVTLPPGSTTAYVPSVTGGTQAFVVRSREMETGAVSPDHSATQTAGAAALPIVPYNGGLVNASVSGTTGVAAYDGTLGMVITPIDRYAELDLETATETGVGTGVYGAYSVAQVVTRTPYTGDLSPITLVASPALPDDGLRRLVRVRAIDADGVASGYTTPITWSRIPGTSYAPASRGDFVVRTTTVNDSLSVLGDNVLRVDTTSGNLTISLPTALGAWDATTGKGLRFDVKKVSNDVHTVTVSPAGADLVDGSATFVLTAFNQSVTLQSFKNGATYGWSLV